MIEYVFPYELSIVAIIRDEGLYLQEWIDYHINVGVNKFYIYDNGSNDNTFEILQPYIDDNIVDYLYVDDDDFDRSKINLQIAVYNDAIIRHKYDTRFMIFIDIDEFVLPYKENNILNVVENIMSCNKAAAGIVIYWRCFGSSGLIKRPLGGVLRNYTYRGYDNFWNNNLVKTIANPRLIEGFFHAPHECNYFYGCCSLNENGEVRHKKGVCCTNSANKIRINHYFVKSREDWKLKMKRGRVDMPRGNNIEGRTWDMFQASDCNDLYDNDINRYISKVKSKRKCLSKHNESNAKVISFMEYCSTLDSFHDFDVDLENMFAFYRNIKEKFSYSKEDEKVWDKILEYYVISRTINGCNMLTGTEVDMLIEFCHEEIYIKKISYVANRILLIISDYLNRITMDSNSREYFVSRLRGMSSDSAVASYFYLENSNGIKLLKKMGLFCNR